MNGFISRIITRHAYPQNNIIPRLPGKYESTAGVTQNYENDFGTSGISSTDNHEDVGNNELVHHQKQAHDSIESAIGNEGFSAKSQASTANFKTPFSAKPAETTKPETTKPEINKHERSGMPNEDKPTYQTTTPKVSTAVIEQSNNGAVNHKLSHNHIINEKNATDSIAISSDSSRLFASRVSEKLEKIKEATTFQIQQPLFTTPPTSQPYGVAPLTSNKANDQPVIKVHIGKIEIKAINQPSSNEVHTKKSNANKPAMSLDDYLKKRNAR